MVKKEGKKKVKKESLIFSDSGKKVKEIENLDSKNAVNTKVLAEKKVKNKKISREKNKEDKDKSNVWKFFIIISIFIIVILLIVLFLDFGKEDSSYICGDGTFDGECSEMQPYICLGGTLVQNVASCGCPGGTIPYGEICHSNLFYGEKNLTYSYVLRGEVGTIDFVAYEGVVKYLSNISREINHSRDARPTRRDFKLLKMQNDFQRASIFPLIASIVNSAEGEVDQVRIATSLVQSIPYGVSGEYISIGSANLEVNVSRYPYGVLYDNEGVCEGKSELLSLILKELGYGVALFYYPEARHEAVGVLCPVEYSFGDTGYCFVETTGRAIISDDENYYEGYGKLYETPVVIPLFAGKSLPPDLYEYRDSELKIILQDDLAEDGKFSRWDSYSWKNLVKKYGLEF